MITAVIEGVIKNMAAWRPFGNLDEWGFWNEVVVPGVGDTFGINIADISDVSAFDSAGNGTVLTGPIGKAVQNVLLGMAEGVDDRSGELFSQLGACSTMHS